MSSAGRLVAALVTVCMAAGGAGAAGFEDPAPPAVAPVKPGPAPEAQATRELTFHAAPAPPARDAVTHDWTSLFGPAHAPTSAETRLLKDLAQVRPAWEYAKGNGYSPVSISRDRLVLFHRLGNEEVVECLHPETGRRYWRHAYPSAYEDRYGYTNGPRCAPVIDPAAGMTFTLGAEGKLHAFDLATGQVAWKRDLLTEFKLEQNFFGVGSTPLVEKDVLVVNVGGKGACVVGFDTRTGRARWAAAAPNDWGPAYASPIPATVHGLRRVFVFAGGESRPPTGGLLCVDPATGGVDFALSWRSRRFESVNASSPLPVGGDRLLISECYNRGTNLLKLARHGDRLAADSAWVNEEFGTHFMTPLLLDGHLYGCDGHGPNNCPIVCLDAATGREKWRQEPDLTETIAPRDGGAPRPYRLSTARCHLLQMDGRTLCLTEWGHLLWLDLSPEGVKVTSRRLLFLAPETWSPPVISRGLLYVNQNDDDRVSGKGRRVICYDLRAR